MPEAIDLRIGADVLRFHDDRLGFVMYAYPWGKPGILEHHDGPDAWQREFLTQLGEEVRKRAFDGLHAVLPIRMAVSSGHGVGKSALSAFLVNWTMSTRPRAQGTVTATTFTQLETRTWAAIQQWTRLSITGHWFNVTSGKFDRIMFGEERDRWIRRTVDSRTAKFTNKEQIQQWIDDYGEDGDFVRIRVRGERPRAATNQLIPNDVVAAARKYTARDYERLPKILAVDVARYGDDRTVLGIRQGRKFRIYAKLRNVSTIETTEKIIEC